MRIAQGNILEFSRNAEHILPWFPSRYWPDGDGPPDGTAREETLKRF